ncbi:MAG: ribosome biogenesis GTPase Der [Methylocystis sp.]|nr:ribosome biogenesis GTPase Der [Methylocystis sp.]MCA3584061.1 ribosome biogenesis GTPase Der [Methylocystis sp.]MCA3588973.1 ribosome biogenesis GTPase Der [Methylocystis sp.]MCA3591181.1 ribosome biogenesis GTPase Der [Methylocystis sp.]
MVRNGPSGSGSGVTLAIVGRPNVGKSTLFNRLVGKKLALVDDRPGVTRDRREGEAKLGDLRFTIIDTAGLEEADEGILSSRMREQTEMAIAACDAVLFVIDARVGLTPSDQHFAQVARRSGRPVILLANKAESRASSSGVGEAYALGLGEPVAISAEHGEGMADLRDAIVETIPWILEKELIEEDEAFEPEAEGEDGEIVRPMRIAVLGRPNAGKSTLINRMLGEERLLTGPEAGITRDSIGVDWQWRNRSIRLFDTAGLRKRARIEDKLEKMAVSDALRAVRFAEVVVLLLDAEIPFEKQDLTLADLCEKEGRALVIGINKWDLVKGQNGLLKQLQEKAGHALPQLRGTRVVPVSAAAGEGIDNLMQACFDAHEVWSRRISTSKMNRWLEAALSANAPPAVSGRRIKIKYMTQVKSRPPHFALFGNQLTDLPQSYTRYLVNAMREDFDLPGVPIRLSLRTQDNPYDKGGRKIG